MVAGGDGSAMDLDRAAGDGEAESGAPGRALACICYAREGLEESLEMVIGNAGTVVADRDHGFRPATIDRHFDCSALGGVANGVAEHIVERTSDE